MEVYLVRHTTPAIEKGICYGQSDIPLATSFEEEYKRLISHLPDSFDAVYSSPLGRCYTLAQRLSRETPLHIDNRLMEMSFGRWEMKKWDDIEQEELNRWMQDFVKEKVPGGENFQELNERANGFIGEIIQKDHDRIVIVTHAGVIRCFVSRVLEMPLQNAFRIPYDYAGVTKLVLDGDNCFSRVEFLNRF